MSFIFHTHDNTSLHCNTSITHRASIRSPRRWRFTTRRQRQDYFTMEHSSTRLVDENSPIWDSNKTTIHPYIHPYATQIGNLPLGGGNNFLRCWDFPHLENVCTFRWWDFPHLKIVTQTRLQAFVDHLTKVETLRYGIFPLRVPHYAARIFSSESPCLIFCWLDFPHSEHKY